LVEWFVRIGGKRWVEFPRARPGEEDKEDPVLDLIAVDPTPGRPRFTRAGARAPTSAPPAGAPRGVEPGQLPDIDQEVAVRFRYPVRFTRGLLDPQNRTLRDAVAGDGRARLLVVIHAAR
jgi:hypothetical protein